MKIADTPISRYPEALLSNIAIIAAIRQVSLQRYNEDAVAGIQRMVLRTMWLSWGINPSRGNEFLMKANIGNRGKKKCVWRVVNEENEKT